MIPKFTKVLPCTVTTEETRVALGRMPFGQCPSLVGLEQSAPLPLESNF